MHDFSKFLLKTFFLCIHLHNKFYLNLKEENFFLLEVNANKVNSLIDAIKKYDIRKDITIELQKNFYTKVIITENLVKNYVEKIKKKKIYRKESFLFFIDPRSKDFCIIIL